MTLKIMGIQGTQRCTMRGAKSSLLRRLLEGKRCIIARGVFTVQEENQTTNHSSVVKGDIQRAAVLSDRMLRTITPRGAKQIQQAV